MWQRLFNTINFRTFRAHRVDWKRLVATLGFVVVLPLVCVALLGEWIAWRTGEDASQETIAIMQVKNPQLRWGPFRDGNAARYKLTRAAEAQPDVLIMGSSRTCQFRQEMFEPYSFYNMSRISWPLYTYTPLLQHILQRCHPKVIIMGVDFFLFNHRYSTYPAVRQFEPRYDVDRWHELLMAWRDSFVSLYDHPQALWADGQDPLDGGPVIGLQANLNSGGFRLDGSEAQPLHDLVNYHRPDRDMLKGNILNTLPLFFGDKMDSDEMKDFENFVALAHSQNIQVIGVQMPMYGPLVRYLENDPHFGILRDFRARIASGYFDRLGVPMFDLLELPPYANDPRYFVIPYHPSEVVSAAALFVMLSDPRVKAILPKIDQKALADRLVGNFSADQQLYLYDDPGR